MAMIIGVETNSTFSELQVRDGFYLIFTMISGFSPRRARKTMLLFGAACPAAEQPQWVSF
ncbi:MAG TPA: hypothetical protein VNH19_07895 [Candidatus Limnocylindrales bacterium]|nr:hypothetical protein [Candidatus Limnocylindrales bacterium]